MSMLLVSLIATFLTFFEFEVSKITDTKYFWGGLETFKTRKQLEVENKLYFSFDWLSCLLILLCLPTSRPSCLIDSAA